MTAFYNEIDTKAAAVLRQLIDENVIAPGVVDTRSIVEIQPDEIRNYTQIHFFAGGGLWSIAARMAGWPDDRPLWTGSCPCQPFSVAGKGKGADDPRHLWPHFHRLISACRPPVVVGEQVAGAAGYGWFDGVRADLEKSDYASRAVNIPACAIDAPHQRKRLYWLAVANASSTGRLGYWGDAVGPSGHRQEGASAPLPHDSYWARGEWIPTALDGKLRRGEPSIPILADGFPHRMDLWRIAGNAIVPGLAAEVLRSFMETGA